ncbi:hypothetical protein WMY93_012880 [Mugilogobius chulae]|uniref:Tetraspanin n=1 Tax=Mugilogobius chulae TaxID=88201 RepID=A0AAW0PA31_9GOBI
MTAACGFIDRLFNCEMQPDTAALKLQTDFFIQLVVCDTRELNLAHEQRENGFHTGHINPHSAVCVNVMIDHKLFHQRQIRAMGKGCLTVTKYFLFLFNLIFFLSGGLILGFGLWLLLDNQSFIVVLSDSMAVKLACYILIGSAVCSACISRAPAHPHRSDHGRSSHLLPEECVGRGDVEDRDQSPERLSREQHQDGAGLGLHPENHGVLRMVRAEDWNGNMAIVNSSQLLFPCSCQNVTLLPMNSTGQAFCESSSNDWPVYDTGCSDSVEAWLRTNLFVILGVCAGVAFIELLGMILSICLCRNVEAVDYTKVPKY